MKSSAPKAGKLREVVPLLQPTLAIPPVVSLRWLSEVWTQGEVKLTRLRAAHQNDPDAPLAVCGGGLGSKLLFNGPEAVAWLERISKPGCWPKVAA